MADPRYPNNQLSGLNRVSESMIIPNIIQFVQADGVTFSGATLRGGINFIAATGASGSAIRWITGDSGGADVSTLQLEFNAHLDDLEDVNLTGTAAAGCMLVYNPTGDKFESKAIAGHATVGADGTLTIETDVVGITNLNVATEGSSGHILFNINNAINFAQPYLSHLSDVNTSSSAASHILIYNASNNRFENKALTGDLSLTEAGALTIDNNKIGIDELNISAGTTGQIIGVTGGGLGYFTRHVNIDDITGPGAGLSAIMFHDGATASFRTGLELPTLDHSVGGGSGGYKLPTGTPSSGLVLGVTSSSGPGSLEWAWLNVVEIGTGATGIGGLAEINFTSAGDYSGQMFIGNGAVFQNKTITGDIDVGTIAGGNVPLNIVAGAVGHAELEHDGITLMAGDGLTFSSGWTGPIAQGQTVTLTSAVDDSTIALSGSSPNKTLIVKGGGVGTSQIADDAVTVDKLNSSSGSEAVQTTVIKDSAVTNAKLAGSIANAKLANSAITVTDGSSSTAVSLGGTVTFTAGEGIDIGESSGTLTFAGEDASASNKGVASFSNANFSITSGAVSIKTQGVSGGEIANSTVGLTAMYVKSGQEGSSGSVMIRFDDSSFGFVPQSSVAATLTLNDLTDVVVGTTAAKHVPIHSGGTAFATRRLDATDLNPIAYRTILGNADSSGTDAPSAISANQLVSIINTAASQSIDAGVVGLGAYGALGGTNEWTGANTFTQFGWFKGAIQVGDGQLGDVLKMRGGHIVQAPSTSSGGWARGHLWSGTSNWSDGATYPYLGGIGMYGAGSSDETGASGTMWISAETSTAPWSSPSITIDTSGRVGINMSGYERASHTLEVVGNQLTTKAAYFATSSSTNSAGSYAENSLLNHVVIGATASPYQNGTSHYLHISPGTNDGCSFVALDHGTNNNDFGAIYFGEYTAYGAGANVSDVMILGHGPSGGTPKLAIRIPDGIFRVSDANENNQWFQVEADGQISIGSHNSSNPDRARGRSILDIYPYATNSFQTWTGPTGYPLLELGGDGSGHGTIHIDPYGTDVDNPGAGGAITFGAQDYANKVVAGIYAPTNAGDGQNYGSKMIFATTDVYNDGPKKAMWIDNKGAVAISQVAGRADANLISLPQGGNSDTSDAKKETGMFVENSIFTKGSLAIEGSDGTPDDGTNWFGRGGGIFSTDTSTFKGHIYFHDTGPVIRHKHEPTATDSHDSGPYIWMPENLIRIDTQTDVDIDGHSDGHGYLEIEHCDKITGYGEGIMPFVFYRNLEVTGSDDTRRYQDVPLTSVRQRGADCVEIAGDALQHQNGYTYYRWFLGYYNSADDYDPNDNATGIYWRRIVRGSYAGQNWYTHTQDYTREMMRTYRTVGGYNSNNSYPQGVSFNFQLRNLQRNFTTPGQAPTNDRQLQNNYLYYTGTVHNWFRNDGHQQDDCEGYWKRDADVTNFQVYMNDADRTFINGKIIGRVIY